MLVLIHLGVSSLKKESCCSLRIGLGSGRAGTGQGQVPTKIAIIHVQNAILSTKDGQKAAADLQATFNPASRTGEEAD